MQIFTPNLGMVITEKCNMNCDHCLQGCGPKNTMSKEVIDATLQQFRYIGNLSVCGGEPTLATKQMEMLFLYIMENNLRVEGVSTVINGTNYSEEFLRLLKEIDDYMKKIDKPLFKPEVTFGISYDKYHMRYMQEHDMLNQYMQNLKLYQESPFFKGVVTLKRPIRQGNAKNLPWYETKRFIPPHPIIYYPKENDECICIGLSIAIAPDGTVTEIDASIIERDKYSYGNVLGEQSIADMYVSHPKTRALSKKRSTLYFLKQCDKAILG